MGDARRGDDRPDRYRLGGAAVRLKEIEERKIRLLARASDLPVVRGQTIRVLATRADVLDKRGDAIARYMDAYRETVDYIYSDDPKAILAFAEIGGISPEIARRTREMFDRPQLQPDEIKGLDIMMPEAVKLKFLPAPLTADQIRELIQIPPPH